MTTCWKRPQEAPVELIGVCACVCVWLSLVFITLSVTSLALTFEVPKCHLRPQEQGYPAHAVLHLPTMHQRYIRAHNKDPGTMGESFASLVLTEFRGFVGFFFPL